MNIDPTSPVLAHFAIEQAHGSTSSGPSQLPGGGFAVAADANSCWRPVHTLFAAQARTTPEALAIECEGRTISYDDLNRRSNVLAHKLIRLGVRPDSLVGICSERSIELVVGILAILKAGAAYVPLDPIYPQSRLDYILRDTGIGVILTHGAVLPELTVPGLAQLPLSAEAANVEDGVDTDPVIHVDPNNLAYVMYTSGSTGDPKGVQVVHRGVSALIAWAKSVYDSRDVARVLASTSVCFDLSVFELFLPLCSGGAVDLIRNIRDWDGSSHDSAVTLINTVPSAMPGLLTRRAIPTTVRTINLAGEPLSSTLVDQIYAETAVHRVIDLYGPTESTVYSTFAHRIAGHPATIGKPIAGTYVRLLDENLGQVGDGDAGELYIGGEGLARGYHNREDLTKRSFIEDPYDPGRRIYKTGDLARYQGTGNLEFLGRVDHQVKIRGYRIELGEIEVELLKHPNVRQAIVVAREDEHQAKRLVAYIVPTERPGPTTSELRGLLKERLPEYMVPAIYMPVDSLPLNLNGKVDRAALPAPDRQRTLATEAFARATMPTEERLAAIWEEVLELDGVGIHDSFFELGGDSLLAVRACDMIAREFNKKLPAHLLFVGATIERQASLLESEGSISHSRYEISGRGTLAPVVFMPDLVGSNSCPPQLIDLIRENRPMMGFGLRTDGFQSIERLAAGFAEELVEAEVATPFCVVGYSFGGIVGYELARQLRRIGRPPALTIILDAAPQEDVSSFVQPLKSPFNFARNLPSWLKYVAGPQLAGGPGAKLGALGRMIGRRSARAFKQHSNEASSRIAEFLDVDQLPVSTRADMESAYRRMLDYEAGPYDGRVLLIRAAARPLLEAARRDLGWGRLLSGQFDVTVLPGSHKSILREPHVTALADHLSQALAEIDVHHNAI